MNHPIDEAAEREACRPFKPAPGDGNAVSFEHGWLARARIAAQREADFRAELLRVNEACLQLSTRNARLLEREAELRRDADGMRSVIAQCSSIMHGQGVEDQGQAWDRVFDLLTQAVPVFTTGRELDSERLDWLEQKAVNVRQPALHGSFDLFWSKPPHPYDDADMDRSDLRARIDAAIARESK